MPRRAIIVPRSQILVVEGVGEAKPVEVGWLGRVVGNEDGRGCALDIPTHRL
jgi:hypothetical protein